MMQHQPVLSCIVTVGDERPIDDIARDLAQAGLAIGETMREIGCITGSAAPAALAAMRGVHGVLDVSEDLPIQLPPQDGSPT